jgi:hypothetical protein
MCARASKVATPVAAALAGIGRTCANPHHFRADFTAVFSPLWWGPNDLPSFQVLTDQTLAPAPTANMAATERNVSMQPDIVVISALSTNTLM